MLKRISYRLSLIAKRCIIARLPRYALPGQPQHVIQRGNNRESIFAADGDYVFYLEKLEAALSRYDCALHAYILMTNHVHFLMTPDTEDGIGKVMQSLGRHYVQYFNYCYQRTGTLWEGRYRATLIDSNQYLLTCMRYIELNPVRAGMVDHPQDYRWSNYHTNALGQTDELITPHKLYRRLGPVAAERQKAYRQLFKHRISGDTVSAIRESTNKAWVLGNHRFQKKIERLTERRTAPRPRGGDRKSEQFRESRILRE